MVLMLVITGSTKQKMTKSHGYFNNHVTLAKSRLMKGHLVSITLTKFNQIIANNTPSNVVSTNKFKLQTSLDNGSTNAEKVDENNECISLKQWHEKYDSDVLNQISDFKERIKSISYLGKRYYLYRAYETLCTPTKGIKWLAVHLKVSRNTIKKAKKEHDLYVKNIDVFDVNYKHRNKFSIDDDKEQFIKETILAHSTNGKLTQTISYITEIVNSDGDEVSHWLICDRIRKYGVTTLKSKKPSRKIDPKNKK